MSELAQTISNLRYADDTALLATTENELQTILNNVMQISDDFGLLMNVKKTKVMVISKTEIQTNILINNEKIEQVLSFTYLDTDLNHQNDSTTKLWKISMDRSVNIKTKLRLLKSLLWRITLYGCKTWTLKAADEKKLTAFELWTHSQNFIFRQENERACS